MLVVSILSVGALVAFFFYHRYIITKFEYSLLNLEAEIDYVEDVIQTMRLHISEMEVNQLRRSQILKKTAKKRGRPVNPNSVRQKKMKAGK